MKNFIAHTNETRNELLNSLKYASTVEDLFKQVPIKFSNFDLGEVGLSSQLALGLQVRRRMEDS